MRKMNTTLAAILGLIAVAAIGAAGDAPKHPGRSPASSRRLARAAPPAHAGSLRSRTKMTCGRWAVHLRHDGNLRQRQARRPVRRLDVAEPRRQVDDGVLRGLELQLLLHRREGDSRTARRVEGDRDDRPRGGASKKTEIRYVPIVRKIDGKEHSISIGKYGRFRDTSSKGAWRVREDRHPPGGRSAAPRNTPGREHEGRLQRRGSGLELRELQLHVSGPSRSTAAVRKFAPASRRRWPRCRRSNETQGVPTIRWAYGRGVLARDLAAAAGASSLPRPAAARSARSTKRSWRAVRATRFGVDDPKRGIGCARDAIVKAFTKTRRSPVGTGRRRSFRGQLAADERQAGPPRERLPRGRTGATPI